MPHWNCDAGRADGESIAPVVGWVEASGSAQHEQDPAAKEERHEEAVEQEMMAERLGKMAEEAMAEQMNYLCEQYAQAQEWRRERDEVPQ